MIITNRYRYPQTIVDAARQAIHGEYDGFDSDHTSSSIETPIYQRRLVKENWDIIRYDVADLLWIVYGQAVHVVLEWADKSKEKNTYVTERRIYHKVDGLTISGKYDVYYTGKKLLQDYKNTKAWTVSGGRVKPEWEKQMNYMRWIMYKNDLEVDKAEIVAILRDWNEWEHVRDHRYPNRPIKKLNVQLHPIAQVEQRLMDRVNAYEAVRSIPVEKLKPCTPDDCWYRPERWGVKKAGNKKVSKTFATQEEASAWGDDYKSVEIVYYKPRRPRCETYCFAASVCPDWMEFSNKTNEGG